MVALKFQSAFLGHFNFFRKLSMDIQFKVEQNFENFYKIRGLEQNFLNADEAVNNPGTGQTYPHGTS